MPPADGVRVRPEDLDAHAGHLDAVADALRLATAAGRSVRLGGDAYGQLCALVPVLVDQVQRVLVDGLDGAAGSVRESAGRLRTAAGRYRGADARAQAALDGLRGRR
ncbi:type VII secretion target [Micromonospora echinaurantiaca]|uniref:type VII secretion target n=1 Tax=Micromonospora echinaurantiaca TaxID=47857 RepID=UPI0034434D76